MGFKSTWLVIIALLVVAMGIAAFVIEHVANEAQVRAVAEETNSQHADEQSGLPASVEWFVANEHPSDLTDLQRRHLAAQESTEVWSFYATVITGIAAILTLATLIFLRLSFREARRSADQAVEANRIASATAERQTRAYVATNTAKVSLLEVDRRPKFEIELRNAGNTPAFIRKTKLFVRLADEPHDETKFIAPPPTNVSSGPLNPGAPFTLSHQPSRILDLKSYEEFIAGERIFTVAGYVIYDDVFGKTRRTIFRYFADPNVRFEDDPTASPLMVSSRGNRMT